MTPINKDTLDDALLAELIKEAKILCHDKVYTPQKKTKGTTDKDRAYNALESIPFMRDLISKTIGSSSSFVKLATLEGLAHGSGEIPLAFHGINVALTATNIIYIPLVFIAALAMGKERFRPSFVLTTLGKWVYSLLILTLGILALALPITAPIIGLAVSTMALGAALLGFGKQIYNTVKLTTKLKQIDKKIAEDHREESALKEQIMTCLDKINALQLQQQLELEKDIALEGDRVVRKKELATLLQTLEKDSSTESNALIKKKWVESLAILREKHEIKQEIKQEINVAIHDEGNSLALLLEELERKQTVLHSLYNQRGSVSDELKSQGWKQFLDKGVIILLSCMALIGASLAFVFPVVGASVIAATAGAGLFYLLASVSLYVGKAIYSSIDSRWLKPVGERNPSGKSVDEGLRDNNEKVLEGTPSHDLSQAAKRTQRAQLLGEEVREDNSTIQIEKGLSEDDIAKNLKNLIYFAAVEKGDDQLNTTTAQIACSQKKDPLLFSEEEDDNTDKPDKNSKLN